MNETLRLRAAALALLGVVAGAITLTVAMYRKEFTRYDTVTVHASRAGLQMRPGTVVKIKGVDVGKIRSAHPAADGGADIELDIKPEMMSRIPSDVTVSLEQLTAFGNKAVVLTPPANTQAAPLRTGQTLQATHISVEANELLDHLASVLQTLRPATVNATLSSIADALRGQGDRLGHTLDTVNTYLGELNRDLPTLRADFRDGSTVLDEYADATPDLLAILSGVTTTGQTVIDEKADLVRTLDALQTFAESGTRLSEHNKASLQRLLADLRPTASLLARYSPEFACFFQGMDKANRLQEPNWGGTVAGVTAEVTVMGQGTKFYQYPDDLPRMSATGGPNCWGLPDYDGRSIPPGILTPFEQGLPQRDDSDTGVKLADQPLSVSIFGPLANLIDPPASGGATSRGGRR